MSGMYLKNANVTVVTLQGKSEGVSVRIPDTMTILAIEKHLKEVREWLS